MQIIQTMMDLHQMRAEQIKKLIIAVEAFLIFEIMLLLLICPFTKVEESFNIQAMHDVLFHGFSNLDEWDHFEFPGVVPRTFVGALTIAGISSPFHFILSSFGAPRFYSQYLVRAVLGLLSWLGMRRFGIAVGKVFGADAQLGTLLVTCCQFHLPFYMSRPLPNTLALVVLLFAFSAWVEGSGYMCVLLGTMAAVIFRCDVIILAGPVAVSLFVLERVELRGMLLVGLLAAGIGLVITVLYDSFLWRRWLWPEGEVLFFNTIQNKSSEWGTQHSFWYFTSAIPRALLLTGILVPAGLIHPGYYYGKKSVKALVRISSIRDPLVLCFFGPVFVFVYLYSLLPHKELRFIFPALPILNMTAGIGLSKIFKSPWEFSWRSAGFIFRLAGVSSLLLSLLAAGILACCSFHNYPGGRAFYELHTNPALSEYYRLQKSSHAPLYVHIGVGAAMTGVSRFWEGNEKKWLYSKEEGIKDFRSFDFILTDSLSDIMNTGNSKDIFEVAESIPGFEQLNIFRLKVETAPKIFILRKKLNP